MAFIQPLGQLRVPVSTYATLPVTGNVIGDLRITSDVGSLYTWMIVSPSGSLSDWKKVTVSSYNDLQGRPTATPLAIDNALLAVRNVFLNFILISWKKTLNYGMRFQKMVDGLLDNFNFMGDVLDPEPTTIDVTKSVQAKWLGTRGLDTFDFYYMVNFNGEIDDYTGLLIHGYQWDDEMFYDAIRNPIVPNTTGYSSSITKFSNKSFAFNQAATSYLYCEWFRKIVPDYDPNIVNGQDFTWDFWVRPSRAGVPERSYLVCDYGTLYPVPNPDFYIEKDEEDKIHVYMRVTNDGVSNSGPDGVPNNAAVVDVTGTTSLAANTWYHIEVTRQSGYLKIYVNGTLEGTSLTADNRAIANASGHIGYAFGKNLLGHMDEIRYSKGIARHTANFTPKTVIYNAPIASAPTNNMVLQSQGFEANEIPSSARIVLFVETIVLGNDPRVIEDVVPNDDIKVYISRDGGTTFTQGNLLREFDVTEGQFGVTLPSPVIFYVATVDLVTQPNGKEMVWKITTHNNKQPFIRSVALNWK